MVHHSAKFKSLVGACALGTPMLICDIDRGYLWFEFFFALSGFMLVHLYGSRAQELWKGKAYLSFVAKRLARLYPVHIVTTCAIVVLMLGLSGLAYLEIYITGDPPYYRPIFDQPHIVPFNVVTSSIADLFFVQGWQLLHYPSWNPASWYASVQFLLCLLLPTLIGYIEGHRPARELFLAGLVILAMYLLMFRVFFFPLGFVIYPLVLFALFSVLSKTKAGRGAVLVGVGLLALATIATDDYYWGLQVATFHNGVFRGMGGFFIGAALAMLFAKTQESWSSCIPEWVHNAAQAIVLVYLAWSIYGTHWHGQRGLWIALGFYLLIFVLAFDRGILGKMLAKPLLQKLGCWSYGIFMGHTLVRKAVGYFADSLRRWTDETDFNIVLVLLLALLFVGGAIAVGAILALHVEAPVNAWLRARFARSRLPHVG